MTKDTGDFRQFRSVACREYTLPRDDPTSQTKGWIQGDMRIGPVLEVTCFFQITNNVTEVPEDQTGEQALQLNVKDCACQSKAKAKPQRKEPASYSPSIIPMNEKNWIDIEPGIHSLSAYEISKKVIHLLQHSQIVQREADGEVQYLEN